jgi:multiple sugar transport system ATP-binding protein
MNFLHGRLARSGGGTAIDLGDGVPLLALPPGRSLNGAADGAAVILGLRPEHVGRAAGAAPAAGSARLETTIELVQPTGSRSYASFRLGSQPLLSEFQAHDVGGPGEQITVDINLPRATIFDPETGRAL